MTHKINPLCVKNYFKEEWRWFYISYYFLTYISHSLIKFTLSKDENLQISQS